jgi:predicted ester cyclase
MVLASRTQQEETEMSNESIKQTARTMFEYVDHEDFDSWRSLVGPDLAASANGGDTMSRDEFEGMVRGIGSAFSNGRHIIDTQVVEGDVVATNLTWTAVHTGEFEGVPASNRPVRICGSSFDRIVDGKVVEHHAQFDAMGLMVQIGAIPVPA